MRATVLIENSQGENPALAAEFGLSILIETDEASILLDTGSTGLFIDNLTAMEKDINEIEMAVITHGHFDHGGGLKAFFERRKSAKVYLKKGANRKAFGTLAPYLPAMLHKTHLLTRDIGLDNALLHQYEERIEWVSRPVEIAPKVHILTEIPKDYDKPAGNRFLLTEEAGKFVADDFSHELLLVVEAGKGLVVFSGCAHNGILNMVSAAKSAFAERPIQAVIGGFHLNLPKSEKMSASKGEIEALAKSLGEMVEGNIYTGHCTGEEAFATMKPILGEKLRRIRTGSVIEIY